LVNISRSYDQKTKWLFSGTLYILVVSERMTVAFCTVSGCPVRGVWVGWLEFNVPFEHKYGYIRDEGVWVNTRNGEM